MRRPPCPPRAIHDWRPDKQCHGVLSQVRVSCEVVPKTSSGATTVLLRSSSWNDRLKTSIEKLQVRSFSNF